MAKKQKQGGTPEATWTPPDADGSMKFQTKNYYGEVVLPRSYGYFEHEEYGDGQGGGLWFAGKELIDYDGVFSLPLEVVSALRSVGFIVDKDFE